MNRQATALIVKFVIIGLVLVVLLPIFSRLTSGQAILTAAVLTLVAYFAGDLGLLPRYGNITATAADAVIAALIIGLADWTVNAAITLTPLGWVLVLGALAAGEYFFHRYLRAEPAQVKEGGEEKL